MVLAESDCDHCSRWYGWADELDERGLVAELFRSMSVAGCGA